MNGEAEQEAKRLALAGPPGLAWALLLLLIGVGSWELWAALRRPAAVASRGDWQAAAAVVRAELRDGDLIATAPLWAEPLTLAELGDLMPVTMVGRPDSRAYRRIWGLSIRGAEVADAAGLSADWSADFGPLRLRRYSQPAVAVTFDLVASLSTLRVGQQPLGAAPAEPIPCPFQGPLPTELGGRSTPVGGAFRCPQGSVERRTLELDFRPRYGLAVALGAGQQTVLSWVQIPAAAWQGAQLRLWFGLHDNSARRYARGPVEITVDLDDGLVRVPLRIEVAQPMQPLLVGLPLARPGAPVEHRIRIEASAAEAAHHILGVLGRLERSSP